MRLTSHVVKMPWTKHTHPLLNRRDVRYALVAAWLWVADAFVSLVSTAKTEHHLQTEVNLLAKVSHVQEFFGILRGVCGSFRDL